MYLMEFSSPSLDISKNFSPPAVIQINPHSLSIKYQVFSSSLPLDGWNVPPLSQMSSILPQEEFMTGHIKLCSCMLGF